MHQPPRGLLPGGHEFFNSTVNLLATSPEFDVSSSIQSPGFTPRAISLGPSRAFTSDDDCHREQKLLQRKDGRFIRKYNGPERAADYSPGCQPGVLIASYQIELQRSDRTPTQSHKYAGSYWTLDMICRPANDQSLSPLTPKNSINIRIEPFTQLIIYDSLMSLGSEDHVN